MISIRSKAVLILFSGLVMSSAINANEINITNSNIIFEEKYGWSECENGFHDPKTKYGKMTKDIKKQVYFDENKNWMRVFQNCTYAKFNGEKYMIRSFSLVSAPNALHVIFKDNRAFGIYGDYGPNGEWFNRKGSVGGNTETLEKILDFYLVNQEWRTQSE